MKNNLAPQARLLMGISFILLTASLILIAGFAPNAVVAIIAMAFVSLLYRVGRRYILHRHDLIEVPSRWANPDPLGPMIDRAFTGETVRLEQPDEEARYAR